LERQKTQPFPSPLKTFRKTAGDGGLSRKEKLKPPELKTKDYKENRTWVNL